MRVSCRFAGWWRSPGTRWGDGRRPVSKRAVYAGVAEVSVYFAAQVRGQGVGRWLLDAMVLESERQGIWTLQAGIFPENAASTAAHARAEFRVLGTRGRSGCLNGRWRDVVLMARRSGKVGV
jgi:L-amino acid N-acyltransferase YncA